MKKNIRKQVALLAIDEIIKANKEYDEYDDEALYKAFSLYKNDINPQDWCNENCAFQGFHNITISKRDIMKYYELLMDSILSINKIFGF